MPALLTRTSSDSISCAARAICAALVTSSVTGVTLGSAISRPPRTPPYTRLAPRLRASLISARPIPRLAPVIKTDLFARCIPALLQLHCERAAHAALTCITGVQVETHRCAQSLLRSRRPCSGHSVNRQKEGKELSAKWRNACADTRGPEKRTRANGRELRRTNSSYPLRF